MKSFRYRHKSKAKTYIYFDVEPEFYDKSLPFSAQNNSLSVLQNISGGLIARLTVYEA